MPKRRRTTPGHTQRQRIDDALCALAAALHDLLGAGLAADEVGLRVAAMIRHIDEALRMERDEAEARARRDREDLDWFRSQPG